MKNVLTILFFITLVICCSITYSCEKFKHNVFSVILLDTSSEHLIYKGQLVEMYVEKSIFHSPAHNNFLLKFSIKNISDKAIWVDLSDYWKIAYPNQWGFYDKPYREVINERQIIPDKYFDKIELLKKINEGSLTIIKPGETFEYYRDWNGSGEKIETKNKNLFLIISVDGQLLFTNGEVFEHLKMNETEENMRVIVMGYPITHKAIPENAFIIEKK